MEIPKFDISEIKTPTYFCEKQLDVSSTIKTKEQYQIEANIFFRSQLSQ